MSTNNRSIHSLAMKLHSNPTDDALQHKLMAARFERSMELGLEVSLEDVEILFNHTWTVTSTGYAQTGVPAPAEYANCGNTKYLTTLNRLVLSRMLECDVWDIPSNIHADHIDESLGLANCRRENIQPLTATENQKKKFRRRNAG